MKTVQVTPCIPLTLSGKQERTKCKDVARGFSLVQEKDCTTLKGRTTLLFVIWILKFVVYSVFGFCNSEFIRYNVN
jgi:hypothetical protein